MASIQDAVNKNAQRYAAGGEPGTAPQPPATPLVSAPPQDLPIQAPQRGQIPISSVNPADINDSNRMYRGQGSRSATYPYPNRPAIASATSSVQASTAAAISPATAALLIQVNGAPTPLQTILDLIAGSGIVLTPDATGGVTIDSTASGDGNIHGDPLWNVDDAVFWLRDDFSATSSLSANFSSQLYWSFTPPTGSVISQSSAPPCLGGLLLPGTGTSADVSIMVHGVRAAWTNFQSQAWPLLDYPSWKCVWEFEVARPYVFSQSTLPVSFSWTQVSTYVGLAAFPSGGAIGSSLCPRPPYFLGVRYDTDTTSPAISDATFKFEAVANSTSSTNRSDLNVQGTVVDTGISAAEGSRYSLEIICTAFGSATLTLSNGTISFSSILTMPKYISTSASNQYYAGNGIGQINPNVATVPAGPGTQIAVSGIIGVDAAFNGTWTALGSGGTSFVNILMGGSIAFSTANSTITCYPALVPYLAFGNDTTSSPMLNSKGLNVDFFAFDWNPGVGGGTGTPNSILARYW